MRRYLMGLSALLLLTAIAIGCSPDSSADAAGGASPQTESEYLIHATGDNLAVKGYDTVAYFTEGKAVVGDAANSTDWHGVTWRFSSAENQEVFKANPEKYAPAYGGYCAWGVAAKNDLFEIDPEAWKIVDGKLYLNFNSDVQQQWLEDVPGFIQKGDANWPGLVNKN